ncbi:hypothetical protein [Sediminibacillus halophilus]|uniref:Uncharacterized protein n=1 Tax=Sediminibacillus halophilus TaxID=482461 RepID=A0A1G9RX09_9BACI|nr:hypothetical protein [Sediminibacillus halophilus]SDM27761.1 hypothetical protein SAMN05216244_2182 [Sediminibacillus halophilus]
MKRKNVLDELEDQLKKTCASYGIAATPSKDFMQLWAELIEKMDSGTKQLLQIRLQEDIAENRGIVFQHMLDIMQQEKNSFSKKRQCIG